MKWKTLRRALGCAVLFGMLGTAVSRAQTHSHCPPGHPIEIHPIPIHPIPIHPMPTEPKEKHPEDLPGQEEPAPEQPAPIEPAPIDPTPIEPAPAGDFTLPDDPGLMAENLVASSAGMQGRGDANNRFNLFDNMSAIPRSQAWFGYQYMDDFDTNFQASAPGTVGDFLDNSDDRHVNLYRFGLEYAFTERFSVAAQAQYVASTGTDFAADAWANPQFLAKYAMIYRPGTVVTAIFGIAPEVAANGGELHETTTRFFPGILFYQAAGERLFFQGGAQMGLAIDNLADTFDFALSCGYWLYRAPVTCGCATSRRIVRGIIPQIEILGKYVFSNPSAIPFADADRIIDPTFAAPGSTFGGVVAFEDRNIYDMTVGTRVLLPRGLSVGLGYSFPLTGQSVREGEFLTSINWAF